MYFLQHVEKKKKRHRVGKQKEIKACLDTATRYVLIVNIYVSDV